MGTKDCGEWSQENLKELAEKKEQEWRHVQQLRAESLEAALKEKERTHVELKGQFVKLKEDFKYNLRLLGERDAELDRYDSVLQDLKSKMSKRDMEISDLKIKLDESHTKLSNEIRSREEMQMHYQHRIREKQTEIEQYRCDKDADIQGERQELESFKRNLERQLKEVEEELEIQRKELTSGFDEAIRKREHEFRLQADEMSNKGLAHEMKAKLLGKELEIFKSAQATTQHEFKQVEGNHRELEKQLKQKHWEIEDIRAMKDTKIAELETKVEHLEVTNTKQNDEFQRKYAELDRCIKEKEDVISRVRQGAQDKELQLMEDIRSLQNQLEDMQIKYRQAEWNIQDAIKEKESTVERLENEISDMKSRWDSHVSQISKSNVQRDLELESLKENDIKVKGEITQRKEDIERYKRELAQAMDREAALERNNAQLDLDWQRRYEDIERQQYERSEDLVKNLTQARDQAYAEVKEKKREMQHKEDMLNLLSKERDQALATLKQHGLIIDKNINVEKWQQSPESSKEQISELEEQNENLRRIIHQMRQEMENLGDTIPDRPGTAQSSRGGRGSSITNEYVRNLEEELKKMKVKCRQLEQQLLDYEPASKEQHEVHSRALEKAGDNMFVKSHVEQLNNTIGDLRSEKVQLTAQLRKHQTRIQHLERAFDQASKQPREKQIQFEQVQYELNANSRRHEAEVSSLKNRVTELELQLAETRKEADEYHRANIERNLEVTALTNQLSHLKMEIAEDRPAVNFGAQELMIQQLQDEIHHLRQIQKGEETISGTLNLDPKLGHGRGLTTNAMVEQLQRKLQAAAKHIAQLAKEKQQLIEMGNRLRAELKQNGIKPSSVMKPSQAGQSEATSSLLQQKIGSKLQQLENLQYELTKQELTKAQNRGQQYSRIPPVHVDPSTTEEEDEDRDYVPQSILKKSAGSSRPGTAPQLSPVPEDIVPASKSKNLSDVQVLRVNHGTHLSRASTAYSDNIPLRQSVSPTREQLLASMSSVGGESLQEIWQMLDDDGGSPRPSTGFGMGDGTSSGPFSGLQFPGDNPYPQNSRSSDALVLKGHKPVAELKPKPQSRKMTDKIMGKLGTSKKQQSKPSIRNWNIRDDNSIK